MALPVILISSDASATTRQAAGLLKDELSAICRKLIPDSLKWEITVVHSVGQDDLESGRLIFSLGRNRYLSTREERFMTGKLKGREQAYIIQPDSAHNNLICLLGSEDIGDYYAASTAIQLLDRQAFVYHSARVFDYPDFLGRSFQLSTWQHGFDINFDLDNLSILSLWKLNGACISYSLREGKRDWYQPDELYRSGISKIAAECRKNGIIGLTQTVNPYYHLDEWKNVDSLTKEERNIWTHNSQHSLNQLLTVFQIGGRSGIRNYMLCCNDYLPLKMTCGMHFTLYADSDRKRFVNLQNAHVYQINRINSWLRSNYGNFQLSFIPPWYINEYIDQSCGEGELYLADLMPQIPEGISILWSGGTRGAMSVDMADIKRFTDLTGTLPVYRDLSLDIRSQTFDKRNYPLHYPGKVRLHSLIEAMDIEVPDSFYMKCAGREFLVSHEASTEIARLQYATVADFLWNQSAYDPDLSLYKVLVGKYGPDLARQIIYFNDSYFTLESICLRMEIQGASNRLVRLGEYVITKMDYHIDRVTMELMHDPTLALELHGHKNRLIERFKRLEAGVTTVTEPALTDSP